MISLIVPFSPLITSLLAYFNFQIIIIPLNFSFYLEPFSLSFAQNEPSDFLNISHS